MKVLSRLNVRFKRLAITSKTSKPILCLVWAYLSPGFPSPTIIFVMLTFLSSISLYEILKLDLLRVISFKQWMCE